MDNKYATINKCGSCWFSDGGLTRGSIFDTPWGLPHMDMVFSTAVGPRLRRDMREGVERLHILPRRNWRAIGATAVGCALAWSGLVVPALRPLYDYAWFVSFAVALASYAALTSAIGTKADASGD